MADIEKAAKNKPKQSADGAADQTDAQSSATPEADRRDAPDSENIESPSATVDGEPASSEANKDPQ
jgi:hypothetical protein